MNDLEEQIKEHQVLGESICKALADEIHKLTLPESLPLPQWHQASFSVKRDPALGTESLEVLWLGKNGEKRGGATLHADGSFFAEYDVIRPHPRRAKWFVESVIAWGRRGVLKSEPQLLPMPE
jgi:hypothetical protein